MATIEQQINNLAQERGYTDATDMRKNMGERNYARLVGNMMPLVKGGVPFEVIKHQSNITPKTIRVYLNQDPSVYVEVKTTEDRVPAKLKTIRKDIMNQQFPRWAPFAGQPQCGNKQDPNAKGWAWTFV
jgi:hypothetical protein